MHFVSEKRDRDPYPERSCRNKLNEKRDKSEKRDKTHLSKALVGLPPDFLLRLVALGSFMRLSLLKGAQVDVGECRVTGNPGRPSYSTDVLMRTWGTRPVSLQTR